MRLDRKTKGAEPNWLVKGCARVWITLYPAKYPNKYTSQDGTASRKVVGWRADTKGITRRQLAVNDGNDTH